MTSIKFKLRWNTNYLKLLYSKTPVYFTCYKNECDQETQKIGIDLAYTCKVCKFKNVALAFSFHLLILLAAPCHNGSHHMMRQARYGLPSLLATNAIMGPHSHSLI